ncbi:MAG TPA: DUF5667 domain-containing protein [Actinospica sp.]|jgi:hypothetical protein|nr:DUF5667 domain-containing protein [Actinospica sp.]
MNDRQEAEQFAALLDAHAAGRRGNARADSPAGVGALVALAERVEAEGRRLPAADVGFRDALRARLVAEAPSLVAQSTAASGRVRGKVPAQRATRATRTGARHSGDSRAGVFTGFSAAWRRRLLAAGVGVAVATGSVGGIAIASAGAQPGDPLYSAKKIFESLQLSLSGSPTDQGREYLHLADIRLGEIDALLARPDVDMIGSPTQAYLIQVLTELRSMISDGGDLLIGQVRASDDQTALHALADFLLTERQRVADLSWRLPPAMQAQPPQIVTLMDQLSRQLQQAAATAARQTQGSGNGEQPGSGQLGQGGGGVGAASGSANPNASAGASTGSSASASGAGSSGSAGAGSGASTGSSASSTASAGSTIGINVPVPVLPSIGVTLPGLLGLPEVDLGLGDGGASGTPSQ